MSQTLDAPTLLLVLTVTCLASMAVTFAQLRSRQADGSFCWAIALVACALAWLLWSPIPLGLPPHLAAVLGGLVMLAVPVCVARSLFAFAQLTPPHGWFTAVVVLMLMSGVLWRDYWEMRAAIFNLGIAAIFAVATVPLLRPLPDVPTGLRCLVAASLLFAAGSLVLRAGAMVIAPQDWVDINADDRGNTLGLLGNLAGLVVANLGYVLMLRARAKASYTRLARLDPLTGVLNRAGLQERLTALAASPAVRGRPLSLLLVDLLDLSGINQRRGHMAGDEVLRELASRLQQDLPRAWVGRVADDQFLAVIPGPIDSAAAAARRLTESAGSGRLDFELAVGLAAGTLGQDDPLRLVAVAQRDVAEGKRRRSERFDLSLFEGLSA